MQIEEDGRTKANCEPAEMVGREGDFVVLDVDIVLWVRCDVFPLGQAGWFRCWAVAVQEIDSRRTGNVHHCRKDDRHIELL